MQDYQNEMFPDVVGITDAEVIPDLKPEPALSATPAFRPSRSSSMPRNALSGSTLHATRISWSGLIFVIWQNRSKCRDNRFPPVSGASKMTASKLSLGCAAGKPCACSRMKAIRSSCWSRSFR